MGKRKIFTVKRVLLALLALIIAAAIAVGAYAAVVIAKAPKIDTDNIYNILSESTIIYDDKGKELDTVYTDANRDNVKYDQIPDNLKNAFIALEDKSFRKHSGFNFVRIIGALKDAVFSGGRISGTSTITQQLARNVYLKETQYDYSIKRKIIEAYYTRLLEKNLTKDQILEAYLNTIFFGFNSNGVQAASQAYFSKNVEDLSLAQCAALAALPQSPSNYQLVEFVAGGHAEEYGDKVIKSTSDGVYIINDISKARRETCLKLMKAQGYIDDKQYKEAVNTSLKDMLDPNYNMGREKTSYFADYVIESVIEDLMKEKNLSHDQAWDAVYKGGLKIYSTLDSQAQAVIEDEFNNPNNFPSAVPPRDGNSNVVAGNGRVLLYAYSNFFDKEGNFHLTDEEAHMDDKGQLIITPGKRLAVYDTKVNGTTDYSLEFKSMYKLEDGTLYSINGGFVNIPAEFKSKDGDNLVISADFFKDDKYKGFIENSDDGIIITSKAYTLKPKTIQPQAAMAIVENNTGYIKAMQGGRETKGRMIYNRTVNPRQPGSSIKPIGTYGPALQQSYEEAKEGKKHQFKNLGIDTQGADGYGDYFTASSVLVDEPTTIEGKVWPKNFGGGHVGPLTMREALQQSNNVAAVKIQLQTGSDYAAKMVKKFGITTLETDGSVNDLNPAALALGGMARGVTPLEMASAYSSFANGGKRIEPVCYTKVVDRNGDVMLESKKNEHKVIDPGVAFVMTDLLRGVVSGGTGQSAAVSGTPTGGKTGTTDDAFDIWFDGITPHYSASLWIGNDSNFPLATAASGPAARLWGRIMNRIDKAHGGEFPKAPSDVVNVGGEYYLKGTETGIPSKGNFGEKFSICKDSDFLATPDCTNVEERTFHKGADGDGGAPKYYCPIHNKDVKTYPIDPSLMEDWKKKETESTGGEAPKAEDGNGGATNPETKPQPTDGQSPPAGKQNDKH